MAAIGLHGPCTRRTLPGGPGSEEQLVHRLSPLLGDALVVAVLTWYALFVLSIVVAVLFGLLANVIEGNHMDVVTLTIFTMLFWPPMFAVPIGTISSIRRRLLSLSGRVRKPVDDETKVRRYRPRQYDFWISAAGATGFVVVAFLHR